jgi:hypothetical protein
VKNIPASGESEPLTVSDAETEDAPRVKILLPGEGVAKHA